MSDQNGRKQMALPETAGPFISNTGRIEMAKLTAPKNSSGFSFNGVEYAVKKGYINVPEEAVADAITHGFGTTGEDVPADAGGDDQAQQSAAADGQQQGAAE